MSIQDINYNLNASIVAVKKYLLDFSSNHRTKKENHWNQDITSNVNGEHYEKLRNNRYSKPKKFEVNPLILFHLVRLRGQNTDKKGKIVWSTINGIVHSFLIRPTFLYRNHVSSTKLHHMKATKNV